MPGFVTVLLQERTFKSADDSTALDRLLRIFWYSACSYLLVAVVALVFGVHRSDIVDLYREHKGDPALLIWIGASVVLIPSVLIAEATRRWDKSQHRLDILDKLDLNVRHTEPTAWDHFMRQRRNGYVRVTFADGARVLGYYGADSFAAYAKDGQDLYLEHVLLPNNADDQWFGEPVPGNCGVWVKAADAVFIEFYTPLNDGQEPAGPPAAASSPEQGAAGRAPCAANQPDPAQTATATASSSTEEEGLEHEQDGPDRRQQGA